MTHRTHLHGLTLHRAYHLAACHQRLIGSWEPRVTKKPKKVTCKRCKAYLKDKFRIYVATVTHRKKRVGRWRIFTSEVWMIDRFLRNHARIPRAAKITTRLYRGKDTSGVVTIE